MSEANEGPRFVRTIVNRVKKDFNDFAQLFAPPSASERPTLEQQLRSSGMQTLKEGKPSPSTETSEVIMNTCSLSLKSYIDDLDRQGKMLPSDIDPGETHFTFDPMVDTESPQKIGDFKALISRNGSRMYLRTDTIFGVSENLESIEANRNMLGEVFEITSGNIHYVLLHIMTSKVDIVEQYDISKGSNISVAHHVQDRLRESLSKLRKAMDDTEKV